MNPKLTEEQNRLISNTVRNRAANVLLYDETLRFGDTSVGSSDVLPQFREKLVKMYEKHYAQAWYHELFGTAVNNLEKFGVMYRCAYGRYRLTKNAQKIMEQEYGKYFIDEIVKIGNLLVEDNKPRTIKNEKIRIKSWEDVLELQAVVDRLKKIDSENTELRAENETLTLRNQDLDDVRLELVEEVDKLKIKLKEFRRYLLEALKE